jgi:hypothetical protein
MKYFTYLAISSFLFTCLACGHGRPVDEAETTVTTQPVIPANTTTQPQQIPVNLNSQTTPSTTVTPTNTTVAPGMNPPHGQPGHRCDIAVGAPLNSAPATTAPTAVTTPVNISSDKLIQAATTAVAPGMNPPHGQPGHRCDIAVGAPLNSKPASTTATPVNISTEKAAQPVTAVAPGMNPPHGQPGHRCDIAVGAPLDSKPILVAGTPSTNTVTSSQSIPSIVPIRSLPDSSKQNR